LDWLSIVQQMHFTRKTKKFNMQATVRISKLQDGPVPVMRILGIHLDSNLNGALMSI
jgi:hypothetical protein